MEAVETTGLEQDEMEEVELNELPPMRIGVDEWCFHNSMMVGRIKLMDMLEKVASYGVQGIGFDYLMMSKELKADPGPVKDILQQSGMELVFGFGVPFALPDIVHQFMDIKKDEMFDLAHEFGCGVLRVTGGVLIPNMFHKSFHISLNKERELKDVARRLKEFSEDAALEGLTVALENHCDYSASEMLELIDRVNHDNFKVTLDTGNAVFMGEDPVDTTRKLAPYVAYTHIKDVAYNGPFMFGSPLGEGVVDLPAVVEILRDYNYDGLFSIEVDLPLWKVDKEEESLYSSIQHLRSIEG